MATVTDLETGCLIAILPGRSKTHLRKAFAAMRNRQRVEFAAIDMTKSYRDVIREMFPNARVVVDKRHLLNKAREALGSMRERTRKRLRKKNRTALHRDRSLLNKRHFKLNEEKKEVSTVERWTKDFPTLGLAYWLKEAFFGLFDIGEWAEFCHRYAKWRIWACAPELEGVFKKTISAVENWLPEIEAYWVSGKQVTNGLTEARNGTIRQVIREGRGYKHRMLETKLLHRCGPRTVEEMAIREAAEVVAKEDKGYDHAWLTKLLKDEFDLDLVPVGVPLPAESSDLPGPDSAMRRQGGGREFQGADKEYLSAPCNPFVSKHLAASAGQPEAAAGKPRRGQIPPAGSHGGVGAGAGPHDAAPADPAAAPPAPLPERAVRATARAVAGRR